MRIQTLCGSEAVWNHSSFWVGPPRRDKDPAAVTILCRVSSLMYWQKLGKQERLY